MAHVFYDQPGPVIWSPTWKSSSDNMTGNNHEFKDMAMTQRGAG